MLDSTKEQILQRLSIEEVVGSYVKLTRSGKGFKACSPFVTEKTPSFFVSPDKGLYYCFSSQRGGDMFTFIQEMEGVDFKKSLQILADKAGVEMRSYSPGDLKKKGEVKEIYFTSCSGLVCVK